MLFTILYATLFSITIKTPIVQFNNQLSSIPQFNENQQRNNLRKKSRRPNLQHKFMELTATPMHLHFNLRKQSTNSQKQVKDLQQQQNEAFSERTSDQALNSNQAESQGIRSQLNSGGSSQSLILSNMSNKQQQQKRFIPSTTTHNAQEITDKYFINNQTAFANSNTVNKPLAAPLQQTYQMFMPNKIKKGRDLKQNHEIFKQKPSSHHSSFQTLQFNQDPALQLQNMIKNMMPHIQNNSDVQHIQADKDQENQSNVRQSELTKQIFVNEEQEQEMMIIKQFISEQDMFKQEFNQQIGGAFQIKSLQNQLQQDTKTTLRRSADNTPLKQANKIELDNLQTDNVNANILNDQQTQMSQRATTAYNKSINVQSFSNQKSQLNMTNFSAEKLRIQLQQQLYIGNQQLKPKTPGQHAPSSNADQNKLIQSPYGENSNISDMVYQCGFLLKPRSKLNTYIENKKRHGIKAGEIQLNETEKLINVKSLEKLISQHNYQQMLKQSEVESDLNPNLILSLNKNDRSNYCKTVKFLKRFQHQRSSSKAENNSVRFNLNAYQERDLSIMGSIEPIISSFRPNTHLEANLNNDIDSPSSYRPVQKVLITHKDSSIDGKISKRNSNNLVENLLSRNQSKMNFSSKTKEIKSYDQKTNTRDRQQLLLNDDKLMPKPKLSIPPIIIATNVDLQDGQKDLQNQSHQESINEEDSNSSFHAPQWNESPMLSQRTIKMMKAVHEQKYGIISGVAVGQLKTVKKSLPQIQELQLHQKQFSNVSSQGNINPSIINMQSLYHKEQQESNQVTSKRQAKKKQVEQLTGW
eukprot:403375065